MSEDVKILLRYLRNLEIPVGKATFFLRESYQGSFWCDGWSRLVRAGKDLEDSLQARLRHYVNEVMEVQRRAVVWPRSHRSAKPEPEPSQVS